jgi:uncharacterized protein DUF6536
MGNLILLIVGVSRPGGVVDGIATAMTGNSATISRLNVFLHILINIFSTALLTASSYCMQLLSAPTREEVDSAHRSGRYVDIGIMSLRNIRHISTKRRLLSLILALSSIPLHLL